MEKLCGTDEMRTRKRLNQVLPPKEIYTANAVIQFRYPGHKTAVGDCRLEVMRNG